MNLADLRLSGNDELLNDIVEKLNLTVASRVKAGDPRRGGRVHETSGLTISIADAANPGAMLKEIRGFLATCQRIGPNLFGDGVEAELAIGLSVGDSIQFIASVEFSSSELRELATLGIALSIAAYPTSDEVNDPVNKWRQ
jgi:hypothetical protein